MDRAIKQKFWNTKRLLTIIGIIGLIMLISASIYFNSGKMKLKVDLERITVSEIKMGTFQEFIPVNGLVLPVTTIYMDAMEGGRVEERFVEDGTIMKKGQPILRLLNTDLELQLANQETQVFNVLTQIQISKNSAEQNSINRQNQEAEVDNALTEAERVYNINKNLYEQKVIATQEFQSSKNLYDYQLRRKKLTTQIMKTDAVSMAQQVNQMSESYQQMKKTLALMQRKVGDLIVRSPVDGQLTSLDAEIGENKDKGQRLGQIDVMSGFKIRVDIDEHYISRIFTGLKGNCELAGKKYNLNITKVYTQVANGRFQVDMVFIGKSPESIRRGQTLQIRLALSDEAQALLLPKGGFYQQTGGNWIFKIGDNKNNAFKNDIQLGRQNPDYYEVLQGLKIGDQVITSSYENFGEMQELELK